MTSPRRWAWRSATPFSANSPLLPLLTRSDDCLFPGAWIGGGGNAAGPQGVSTLPGKAKRGSTTVPAQLQLRASRSYANARSHWLYRISRARVGGEDVLRRDNRWTLWLAKGEGV
jgi:hypothetical protein